MKQTSIETLFSYWSSLRGDRIAPRRFDIEPSRIADILPHTFILEKIGAQDYRYRIAGTAICDAFCAELHDAPFNDRWSLPDLPVMQRALAAVTGKGAVVRFKTGARTASGATATFDGIFLPLVHANDEINRVLGSLSPSSKPAWIGSDAIVALHVVDIDIAWPDIATPQQTEPREAGPDLRLRERLAKARAALERLKSTPAGAPLRGPWHAADGAGSFEGRDRRGLDDAERQAPFLPHIRKARIVKSERRQFRVYDGGLGKSDDGA
jgi:hypothetical protein